MREIIVGTRGSKLALTQTNMVVDSLKKAHPGLSINTKIIKTTGDKILDTELSKIGGKGLFIKEIEEALANKEVDFAVHSMKDVPHTLPEGFSIGAVLKREDPRDILIYKNGLGLDKLPEGSVIGTSSLRRILQLKSLRADIECKSIRGNIDTRVKKLVQGDFDAIVLATAGIKRMGWQESNPVFLRDFVKDNPEITLDTSYLEIEEYIPSVGQGALALEIRENDSEILDIVKVLNHDNDAKCVFAERSFLKEVNGGCEIPIGAYCKINNNQLDMIGFIGDEEKQEIYKEKVSGNIEYYDTLGVELAQKIRKLMR